MNLLEKLEAEQAAGWPSPPDTIGAQRRHLQELLAVLASAYLEADEPPPDWWVER